MSPAEDGPGRSAPDGTLLWVVGGDDCDHATGDVRELGSDGRNGYYECTRCGATLVFQDETVLSSGGPR